ncbi:hypothetical protein ASZ90_009402 [hydrocarbon metagenome]|uniref:Uncharacterized protein n=1 Tax=hydrocarbon metagenome TaxID=938273 RepID=A0A0W8FIY6_9ZZZZ
MEMEMEIGDPVIISAYNGFSHELPCAGDRRRRSHENP